MNNNDGASEMSRAGLGTGASMRILRLFIFKCDLRAAAAARAASSAESGAGNRRGGDVSEPRLRLKAKTQRLCLIKHFYFISTYVIKNKGWHQCPTPVVEHEPWTFTPLQM